MIRMLHRVSHVLAVIAACATPGLGGEIAGRVLDTNGSPVANAHVLAAESTVAQIFYSSPTSAFATSASEADTQLGTIGHLTGEARTDERGNFAIPDLRAARFTLLAIDAARGFALRLDVGSETKGAIDLALTPGATIEGEFKGFRLDGSKHVLQLKSRAPTANVKFSPNVEFLKKERFRFGPLPAVEGWNVLLTEWVIEGAFSSTLASLPVHATPGSVTRCTLDFAAGESLSGYVRGAHGEPLKNVAVVARKDPTTGDERGAVTDANGRYAIRGLAAGVWTVEARRWTLRSTPGCGVGPKDVFAAREVTVPIVTPDAGDLQVVRLLSTPQLGAAAPAFEVKALDGRTISLSALRGKVVLVDFWATWCGMCRADFPRLRQTYAQFAGGRDFEIVGVSIDDDPEAARRVSASIQLAWPQTALGPVETNVMAQLFNIAATPSSFLIDSEGKIVGVNLTGEALQRELTRLIPAPK